jgi:Breast carcinoma amplified sequence 2 (BCAS2)
MPVRVQVSRDALMDSLPYVDATPEDYEEYAAALIEEEMKTFHPVMNHHHHHHHSVSTTMQQQPVMTLTFRTPLMEKEYQRLVDGDGDVNSHGEAQARALTWLDSTLDSTHILTPPSKKESWEEWKRAIQEAKVAYESERARQMTLEVKKDSGAALLWKGLNGTLDQELMSLQKALDEQRQRVEQINLQRSQDQQKVGKQLQILNTQYQIALERRVRLDQAITALEQEVHLLS